MNLDSETITSQINVRSAFHCHAFDKLQSRGISGIINFPSISLYFDSLDSNDQPQDSENNGLRVDIYLLTARNYEEIILLIESDHRLFPEAQQLLVINVQSLGFLGLTPKKFPVKLFFVFLNNFVELVSKHETLASLLSIFDTPQDAGEFFNQTMMTKTQVRLLILVTKGSTNSEIAKKMVLSEKGIESAIKRLALKLDCYRMSRSEQNLRVLLVRRYNQILGMI